jgi:signal peptidase II
MNESRRITIPVFILIAGLTVAADQLTKYLVIASVPFGGAVEIISGAVNLVHTRNPGAAFGIMSGSEWQFRSVFFICVSIAALMLILTFIVFSDDLDGYLIAGYSLFFGGALGNLVDRVRFGEVIDFLDVHWHNLHWPAFNVADSALCAGAALFLLHIVTRKKQELP